MPFSPPMNAERVRNDFDEIARLADEHGSGNDRYDSFLMSLVPREAASILDVGCGLGRLTAKLASGGREVLGVDLSPEMTSRARRRAGPTPGLSFLCGDFLEHDFGARAFDCVITSATLHHIPEDVGVPRMVDLVRRGGRLVIHDLRSDAGLLDQLQSAVALAQDGFERLLRTGRPRTARVVRDAWTRHGADERYLTLSGARAMASRLLPGSRTYNHWLWRYTVVWDKRGAA